MIHALKTAGVTLDQRSSTGKQTQRAEQLWSKLCETRSEGKNRVQKGESQTKQTNQGGLEQAGRNQKAA